MASRKCCSSSSMESPSTFLRIAARQFEMSCSSDCMFPPEFLQCGTDEIPLGALFLEGFAAFVGDGVVATAATAFSLFPAAFDLAFGFQPMQNRIEHAVGPF